MKPFLNILSIAGFKSWLEENSFPTYRAEQIFKWIYSQWISDPLEMKNIPVDLRKLLVEHFRCSTIKLLETCDSGDGTIKLLLGLDDGETVESVIIPATERITFCLSSQVGCAVQCKFCASGANGLVRNMNAGEIIEQLLLCCQVAGKRPDNLVFMGVGEPMMNIDQLILALTCISDPQLFAMAQRRITISTSGWVKGIIKLAETGKQYNLAVSIHAPDDDTRARLIPGKNRCSIDEIMQACIFYREKTGRMVTLEYTLIDNINTSAKQAEKLAGLANKLRAKVNLIPFNKINNVDFDTPDDNKISNFKRILEQHRTPVTLRLKKGDSVNAACGQLRASFKT